MSKLAVVKLAASYGMHQALSSVSLHVGSNEIVAILGANGAGKSTLLKAIAGICEGESSGEITLEGQSLVNLEVAQIVEAGIAFVPEGRGIFGDLSVQENLELGAYAEHARQEQAENMNRVLTLFPKLRERRKQIVHTMSGGEQQMVAIGRALMSAPKILMLDEPSLGLSPLLCKELFVSLTQIRETGVGILLVEQNAKQSLSIADRGYLLENGKIVGENSAKQLLHDPSVQTAYLGGAVSKSLASRPSTATIANSATASPTSASTVEATTQHAFIPRTNTPRTVVADNLIGDDINALVARASASASQFVAATSAATAAGQSDGSTSLTSPPIINLLVEPDVGSGAYPRAQHSGETRRSGGDVNSQTPATQDAKVQRLLAEFEAAALAASSSSASSKLAESNRRKIDNDDSLPHIPVYRKSPVTVYRRDRSGQLRKQDRS